MKTFRKNITKKQNLTSKNPAKSQKFDYHLRLPFKMVKIELKYLWTFLGFVSISIALLLVIQNLTTYSSNNLSPQKIKNTKLITNFGQKITQKQENKIQEFQNPSQLPLEKDTSEN